MFLRRVSQTAMRILGESALRNDIEISDAFEKAAAQVMRASDL